MKGSHTPRHKTWELIETDLEPLRLAVEALYERVREPKDPNPPS